MKKTMITLVVGLLIVGSISSYALTVYAKGPAEMKLGAFGKQGYGYTQTLETTAKIFDMTSEELQKELESGKAMLDIAKEKGITWDQFHKKMLEAQKEHLQNLVEAGVLTQEWINAKIQIMEQHQQKDCSGDCDCDCDCDCDGAGHETRDARKFEKMSKRMNMRRSW